MISLPSVAVHLPYATYLTHSHPPVEILVRNDGLRVILGRCVKTNDPMLLRVAHNVARWTYSTQEQLNPGDKYKHVRTCFLFKYSLQFVFIFITLNPTLLLLPLSFVVV